MDCLNGPNQGVGERQLRVVNAACPYVDGFLDSATPRRAGCLCRMPGGQRVRSTVVVRVHARMNDIGAGAVGAPAQLTIVAQALLTALINHEYRGPGVMRFDHGEAVRMAPSVLEGNGDTSELRKQAR